MAARSAKARSPPFFSLMYLRWILRPNGVRKNGKTLENIEHLQMRGGKVEAVRCYFGGKNSYPAAVVLAFDGSVQL